MINNIAEHIKKSKKIGITFHCSPDGDAIGSSLALLNALIAMNKDAYIISKEVIPDNLSFLPMGDEIDGNTYLPLYGTDLVIVLDCGNVDRICADLAGYNGDIINIDHHLSNEMFGIINHVESDSAATAEIVYNLINCLGLSLSESSTENINIGTCIYTGILTDTGSFRHSNVTKRTHTIAGELVSIGVSNTEIHSMLFENRPYNKLRLVGEAINSTELLINGKVSLIELSMKMLEKYNLTNIDTSEVISMALSIKDVEVAVVTKEVEDGVKASLRSKNNIDVRKIAEALGGGGHAKAAGLKIKNVTMSEAKEKILKEINKEL